MKLPSWINQSRPAALLGLAVRERELAVLQLHRAGEHCRVEASFTLPLTAAQIEEAPDDAGRQLAGALREKGLGGKRCVVRLPLTWAMAAPVDLPDLAGEDLQAFLELRAEREFGFLPGEAALAHRRWVNGTAIKPRATLLAVAQRRLNAINRMLEAAGRRPLSISIGPGPGLEAPTAPTRVALNICPGSRGLDLVITAGPELLGFRHLDGDGVSTNGGSSVEAAELLREIRLTLGQLSPEVRDAIQVIRFHGPEGSVGSLFYACEPRLRRVGWQELERVPHRTIPTATGALPVEFEGAFDAASRRLLGQPVPFELLAPQVSRAQQLIARYGQGRRRQAMIGGGTLALVLFLAAFIHSRQLASLETQWRAIQPRVTNLEQVQQRIRTFRPWFDTSAPTLRILEQVTSAFPEEGALWAKLFEVKPGAAVSCNGFARNNQAILETLDRLRQTAAVKDLKVRQVRGDNPIQFSFQFTWQHEPET